MTDTPEAPADTRPTAINLLDYERLASTCDLPQHVLDFVNGGATDEITLAENHRAYERLRLMPRVFPGVTAEEVDLKVSILGREVSSPIFITPTAFQEWLHPDGVRGVARASARSGCLLIASPAAVREPEELADIEGGPRWYQVPLSFGHEYAAELADRATRVGYAAICVQADAPPTGQRERDIRHGFTREVRRMTYGVGGSVAASEDPYAKRPPSRAVTWADIEWFAAHCELPVVLKGILSPLDARKACASGAAGVYVSNHGGRQLDTAVATIDALPGVVEATQADNFEVYVDGGIRRGTDVVKALALGARAVGIGRPPLWGLAVNGEEGVSDVLGLLAAETRLALVLCGQRSCSDVARELVIG